jgi:hypothetical protein
MNSKYPSTIAVCIVCECARVFRVNPIVICNPLDYNQDPKILICKTICYSCLIQEAQSQKTSVDFESVENNMLSKNTLLQNDSGFASCRALRIIARTRYRPTIPNPQADVRFPYMTTYRSNESNALIEQFDDLITCTSHRLYVTQY